MNSKSHLSRLGLARTLGRTADDLTEVKALYNDVITMAPDVCILH